MKEFRVSAARTSLRTIAVSWYRKAAEQGFAVAQANLGAMYENGEGVAADNAEAVTWYRKATEQGVSTAQCSLKQVYEQGEGEVIDKFLAFLLCQKLAKEGNEDAQELLNRLKAD